MVTLIKTKQKPAWLNSVKARLAAFDPANSNDHNALDACKDCDRDTARSREPPFNTAPVLGILSFEAARTMSRLISLHRSLAEPEIATLRASTLRSKGVAYLNSTDQYYLLRLACAEMIDELDAAAEAVSRLSSGGGRCKVARQQVGGWAPEFRHQYANLKTGLMPGNAWRLVQMAGTAKDAEKKVKKMAKYVGATAALHEEMESLAEMEASERKLQRWRDYSGPMTQAHNNNINNMNNPNASAAAVAPITPPTPKDPPGAGLFLKRLAMQRKKVRRLQELSLWGKTHDRAVELMAGVVVAIFARICSVFSTIVTQLPIVSFDRDGRARFGPNRHQQILQTMAGSYQQQQYNQYVQYVSSSGPLERNPPPPFISTSGPLFNGGIPGSAGMMMAAGSSGPILRGRADGVGIVADPKPWTAQMLQAPGNTVGGAGLALRYADVVDLAERMLIQPDCVSEDTREELYRMLPGALRAAVRQKLMGKAKPAAAAGGLTTSPDPTMAEGWRDAAGRILEWLAPMAHDTIRWHAERSCERQKLEPVPEEGGARVLLLHTLYFSDRVKAEAAIVEVLVGLSCVCRYQHGACFQKDQLSYDDDDEDDFLNLD